MALTKVVVFDENLYRPTGQVGKWMTKLTTRFGMEARIAAPKRSGRLVSGIETGVNQVGVRQLQGTISSTAPHTRYVIHGTGFPVKGRAGRIYSRRGFARAQQGFTVRRQFFDNNPRDRNTARGKPLPGTFLAVGKQSLYPPIRRMTVVSGQEPNNFLALAWRRTARDHKVLRGLNMPTI